MCSLLWSTFLVGSQPVVPAGLTFCSYGGHHRAQRGGGPGSAEGSDDLYTFTTANLGPGVEYHLAKPAHDKTR